MYTRRMRMAAVAGAAVLAASGAAPARAGGDHDQGPYHDQDLSTVVDGLQGPRGLDALGRGLTLVSQIDGSVSLVVERRHRPARVVELTSVPGEFSPAVAAGPHGTVYILTGGGAPGTGAATLYKWRRSYDEPQPVADIAAYQATDPDPYDLESNPTDTNPFGLAALRDGSVLVADAAGNDLLQVHPDGSIHTVARLKPRNVTVPEGLPPTDPDGNPLPPAGTPVDAEAVATSVTVGSDGAWYVGELRGFPATPGTSEVWRIPAGTEGAVCDPENPWAGPCKRFADGLTSIVDLGAGHGAIYAVSISRMSWLQMELGTPGAEIGGLFRIRGGVGHGSVQELVPGQLTQPGGVDVADASIYVTGPILSEGALMKIRGGRHH